MTEFSEEFLAYGIEFKLNYELSRASSFRIGGPADIAVFPKNASELEYIVSEFKRKNVRFDIIGRGSNVLFADAGYRGALIFTKNMNEITCRDGKIYASCGVNLVTLANTARDNNLCGLEFAYGIPGSVGGAVAMNAGAFGGDMSDVLLSSKVLDTNTGKILSLTKEEHKFDYRYSVFTENKNLICICSEFALEFGEISEIDAKMRQNAATRREKQPLDFPNCGSFFKRPAGAFAGKLIEDCGLKGFAVGGAKVSQKHAGFIINKGHATSAEVLKLSDIVQKAVFEKFGVTLEREVKYIY